MKKLVKVKENIKKTADVVSFETQQLAGFIKAPMIAPSQSEPVGVPGALSVIKEHTRTKGQAEIKRLKKNYYNKQLYEEDEVMAIVRIRIRDFFDVEEKNTNKRLETLNNQFKSLFNSFNSSERENLLKDLNEYQTEREKELLSLVSGKDIEVFKYVGQDNIIRTELGIPLNSKDGNLTISGSKELIELEAFRSLITKGLTPKKEISSKK